MHANGNEKLRNIRLARGLNGRPAESQLLLQSPSEEIVRRAPKYMKRIFSSYPELVKILGNDTAFYKSIQTATSHIPENLVCGVLLRMPIDDGYQGARMSEYVFMTRKYPGRAIEFSEWVIQQRNLDTAEYDRKTSEYVDIYRVL